MMLEKLVFVIFGASGDLTWRKLLPALYDLYRQKMLPERFKILGVGRKRLTDSDFAARTRDGLKQFVAEKYLNEETVDSFCKELAFFPMDTKEPGDYASLKSLLQNMSGEMACESNYLFYYAVPPALYTTISENLNRAGLTCQKSGWKRVIIEKPFGRDYESARQLNRRLLDYFDENQIYRIDHYLGKETVQNILVMRFSNSVLEPLWNRNYVDYVEITSAESIGVGSRAGYYDTAGALRDMLQNHLLQILGIVAMEPPVKADAQSIRNEMVKVFQSLRRMDEKDVPENVVRGQYTASDIKGVHYPAYREEDGVSAESKTETYVAMRCFVDNWRWSGVPFYIRTGKCLPTRVTEVVIHFKPNPHKVFMLNDEINKANNQLVIRIQPDEGLLLKIGMKVPGNGFLVDSVNLDFHYSSLNHEHIPEAYERLLNDCMVGDATLFQRGDAVELTWNYVQPVLDAWRHNPDIPVYGYPVGTWGPERADKFIASDGREWRYPCRNLADDGIYCEL